MRNAFIRSFKKEAEKNNKIILLAADIGAIVFDDFRAARPKQFINVGVAEANMIGVAAGLALNGYIPFCYTIIPFLIMRAFEQIRVDLCIQNLNVKLVGVGAGVSYSTLGPTHHSIEDIGLMRVLPNMTVVSPADPVETELAVSELVNHIGPTYLRLGIAGEPKIFDDKHILKIGKANILKSGEDLTICATGFMLNAAIKIAELLKTTKNINSEIINISTIKPLDEETIINSALKTEKVITIEEHSIYCGLGSAIAEIICEKIPKKIKFQRIGINDNYSFNYGSREYLLKVNQLTIDQIYKQINLLDA